VVLLDLVMPVLDGFGVMKIMGRRGYLKHIPVLVISGETAVDTERKCFDYGVTDFIRKPFDNELVLRRVRNMIDLFTYRNCLEEQVEDQTRTLKRQYEMICRQAEKLRQRNEKITDILAEVVESRNLESGEHVKRVKSYTRILAEELMRQFPEYGLTPEEVHIIESASAVHDIGKIAIPDNVLVKPGKLTDEEFACMKSHTVRGCEVLDHIDVWDDRYKEYAYKICRHHHERFDGRGYPDQLVGDDIPIEAQIVSVADVYDALISDRCYKKAFSKEEAFHMITEGKCGVFSPKLIQCFMNAREAMECVSREKATGLMSMSGF
ncbi:MAG: HD domain-containing protein, partial [Lachnospiraceae bacterium]|nr:HD domain-containing protein [Lachnospiraceae bacterium]